MSKPSNSIKKVKLPNNTECEIVPDKVGSGTYVASLPSLSADDTLVVQSKVATSNSAGLVKPDGTTTSVDANGVISVIGGGGGGHSFETNTSNIKMNGTVSVGSLDTVVRADHIHPSDTTKMDNTNPTGTGYFSLNRKASTTIGTNSFAEGGDTTASGNYSHAEGFQTTASQQEAHAEGFFSTASGAGSHAEGQITTASGVCSHAEGSDTIASGAYSHSEGYHTKAQRRSQHAFGEYNVADTAGADGSAKGTYIEIIGNGTADNARSNARTLDWSGNEVLSGTLQTTGLKDGNNASYKLALPNTTSWTADKTISTMNYEQDSIGTAINPLDDYYNKSYIDNNTYTQSYLNTALAGKADNSSLTAKANTDASNLSSANVTNWINVLGQFEFVGYFSASGVSSTSIDLGTYDYFVIYHLRSSADGDIGLFRNAGLTFTCYEQGGNSFTRAYDYAYWGKNYCGASYINYNSGNNKTTCLNIAAPGTFAECSGKPSNIYINSSGGTISYSNMYLFRRKR